MPDPIFYEKPEGDFTIETSSRGFTREYFCNFVEEQEQAEALIIQNTPARIPNTSLIRKRVQGTRAGHAMWQIVVEYGPGEPNDALGATPLDAPDLTEGSDLGDEWSFESVAQTAHITQADGTIYRRRKEDNGKPIDEIGSGPDEHLAIGLTKDRVEGVDIYAPSFTFNITRTRPFVTLAYINCALYGLVGRVNEDWFYDFAPGEVLYLGCSGNHIGGGDTRWRLSHKFACNPNERELRVGGGQNVITVPKKDGWDYLWVSYRLEKVAFAGTDGIMMQVPEVAYVQKVYKRGDFNLLGIGGARGEAAKAKEKRAAQGRWKADWGLGDIFNGGNTVIGAGGEEGSFGGGGEF